MMGKDKYYFKRSEVTTKRAQPQHNASFIQLSMQASLPRALLSARLALVCLFAGCAGMLLLVTVLNARAMTCVSIYICAGRGQNASLTTKICPTAMRKRPCVSVTAIYALCFLSKSLCQCLLRSGNTLGKRIFLTSSMHFFRSSSSSFLSSSSSLRPGGGPPFSLTVGRGSVFRLSTVGRWGLSAGRSVASRGVLELVEGLEGRGGGRAAAPAGGSSEVSLVGGGGGGRDGVWGNGESRGLWLCMFGMSKHLVSGRLWVRPPVLGRYGRVRARSC